MAVLGFSKPNCDWLRILTSRKSFSGSSSQTLVFGGEKRQPEIRLRSQATTNGVYYPGANRPLTSSALAQDMSMRRKRSADGDVFYCTEARGRHEVIK